MKVLLTGAIFSFLLGSCSAIESDMDEVKENQELTSGKLVLVEMSASMIPNKDPMTGDDMYFQEEISFNKKGDFEKIRTSDNGIESGKGSWKFINIGDEKYIELTYNKETDVRASCTGELTELIRINEDMSFMGTWQACDGPGLLYKLK